MIYLFYGRLAPVAIATNYENVELALPTEQNKCLKIEYSGRLAPVAIATNYENVELALPTEQNKCLKIEYSGRLAQLVERYSDIVKVVGSRPAPPKLNL